MAQLTLALATLMVCPGVSIWTTSDSVVLPPEVLQAVNGEARHIHLPDYERITIRQERRPFENTSDFLVTLRLHGLCRADLGHTDERSGPMGAVTLTNGHIPPHIDLNCSAVLRTIWPALGTDMPLRRNQLFARALVRVLAHELRHIHHQTGDHAPRGPGKAWLNAHDLIAEWGADRF